MRSFSVSRCPFMLRSEAPFESRQMRVLESVYERCSHRRFLLLPLNKLLQCPVSNAAAV